MEIKYGSEYVEEEPDEELGAMPMPVIGENLTVKPATAHSILEQLEGDIQRVVALNKNREPINKNLIAHFKRVQSIVNKQKEDEKPKEEK